MTLEFYFLFYRHYILPCAVDLQAPTHRVPHSQPATEITAAKTIQADFGCGFRWRIASSSPVCLGEPHRLI